MSNEIEAFASSILSAARKRILYLPHALEGMNASKDPITPAEVRQTILRGVIIENYPEDVRGHSCLMLGFGKAGRPLHVVCSPKDEYLAIITAYLPDVHRWEGDWRTRRSS